MFWDESRHTVDAKGRVFLPKRFQSALPMDGDGERAGILTRGMGECLYLFPVEAFQRALDRMDTQAFAGEDELEAQRGFFRYTTRVSLDGSGRFLVPEKYRRLAGIEREVVMCGMRDRVEIWASERYDASVERHEAGFERFAKELTKRSRAMKQENAG